MSVVLDRVASLGKSARMARIRMGVELFPDMSAEELVKFVSCSPITMISGNSVKTFNENTDSLIEDIKLIKEEINNAS